MVTTSGGGSAGSSGNEEVLVPLATDVGAQGSAGLECHWILGCGGRSLRLQVPTGSSAATAPNRGPLGPSGPSPFAASSSPPAVALPSSPFPNCAASALDAVASVLVCPAFWVTNRLLDLRPTTLQRLRLGPCGWCRRVAAGTALALALALALPFLAVGLVLWLPAQATRREFVYRLSPSASPAAPWDGRRPRAFTFVSANVCLMPSGFAKFSNLGETPARAEAVGRLLALGDNHVAASPAPLAERFPPGADFVCLQEAFDAGAEATVCRRLGGTFRHILLGVGRRGLRGCGLKVFGSGLLVASRYPVVAADFRAFPNGAGEDALAAKGVLVVLVLLGETPRGRLVGYLGCTHLQAPAGDALVRDAQLSLATSWLQEFRERQEQPGDTVAFDVFCGDLNFDNCSPAEKLNQEHPIFNLYQDPCRMGPGQDQPWAIGSLLNYLKIYEEPISTPEKMKRTLEEPDGRHQFLAGPILSTGEPDPEAAVPWQGRRVDYILHRQHQGSPPVEKAEISFITQLATLSDHLPVALQLQLGPVSS